MISLYDDQQDLIDRVRDAMRHSKAILCQSATGSGKTIMGAYMISKAVAKGARCMFVVPRRELLRQTAKTLERYDISFGYVSAGYGRNGLAQVQLATAGTLARRLDEAPRAGLVFIDEAHHGGAELERVIAHYRAQGAWVIGLSATPLKTSGKGMGEWYDALVCGPSVAELMAAVRLSQYRMFAPHKPDLSGIKTVMGDYAKGEVSTRMEDDMVLTGNAVRHYVQHAQGKLNVAFCTSVKHAEIVASEFRAQGVPAAAISGKMKDDERARVIKAFARRELHVLANCSLLTFGFDLASAAQMDVTIECMSDLAPTKSLPWQMQKWGRVLRKKAEPAIIFDHAGNVDRHGLPDDDREWSLEGAKKKGGNSEPTVPVRQCSSCYFVHRPSPTCPGCGFVYPIDSRMVEEVEGELAEVMERQRKVEARQEQGRAETLEDLLAVAARTGKKPGWARHVFAARQKKRTSA
jgi:superfamily II DNA or RNA helicase